MAQETPTFGVFGSFAVLDTDVALAGALPGASKKRARLGVRRRGARCVQPPLAVCLESPSPYGVRPEGCALLDGVAPCRGRGLGYLAKLEDVVVLHILGYLPERALCAASAASRALYVFAHHGDLWRAHALARARVGGAWAFARDWKTSCVQRQLSLGPAGPLTVTATLHAPLAVRGFYSDLLYKHWCCTAAAMPPEWWAPFSAASTLPSFAHDALSPAAFWRDFEVPGRPCVLRGAAAAWPALSRWTPAALAGAGAGVADAVLHCGGVPMALADWLAYCAAVSGTDDRALVLFERDLRGRLPALAGDFSSPPHFADDLSALLPAHLRPDCEWLIGGARKTGSTFHKDPNASSAWNALVWGRKAWIMYPPASTPPGVRVADDGSEVATPASVMEWYVDHFEEHAARAREGGVDAPLCGVQLPGDVVFIPAGWWHQVLNLDDSLALSHNFVSPHNLAGVLELWRDDPAAIAGVPPGAQEGMHAAFRAALALHRPSTLAAAEAEEAAREEANAATAAASAAAAAAASGERPVPAKGSKWAAIVSTDGEAQASFTFAALWGAGGAST